MQSESFNNMFGISLYSFRYTGPLRGGHDADVAHGEHEFDTPVPDTGGGGGSPSGSSWNDSW